MATAKKAILAAILLELLDSSDSSSDDDSDEDFIGDMLLCAAAKVIENDRKSSPLEQTHAFDPDDLVSHYKNEEFLMHFRIQKSLFFELSRKYKESPLYKLAPKQLGGDQEPINAERKLLIFLYFAGHQTSLIDVAKYFDVALLTLITIIADVSDFLSQLAKDVIKWPNSEELKECEDYFLQKKKFPHVIGCIGAIHIEIDKPQKDPETYMNKKHYYSIQLQAICNHKNKFIHVSPGCPGIVQCSMAFISCDIYNNLPDICSGRFLLGDSSYPLKTFCITPFAYEEQLSTRQKRFNVVHNTARSVIDETFRSLVQRFRQLRHVQLKDVYRICHVIRACCVIHNLADNSDLKCLDEAPTVELETSLDMGNDTYGSDGSSDSDYASRLRMEIASKIK